MNARAILVAAALVVTVVRTTPVEAQVVPQVVISEIHYHPQPVGTAFPDFNDRENTEFVEILNLESSAVSLGGWCLDRAVDFCFPAGTSLGPSATFVIADDSAAFAAAYGFAPGAVYAGQLSNAGEQIRLVTNAGTIAVDLTWTTGHPWPVMPDGQGPSLELRATGGTLSSPAQWTASTPVGGTPSVAPTLSSAALPLVVSHTAPTLINSGTPVQVVASAINTTGMTLEYNVNYGTNQSITMALGGSGWQATLPALATGAMVRYRFVATGPGGSTFSPHAEDVIDWWAVAVASPQPHNVPVLDLYFTPTAWADIDANRCGCTGTVAYEGRIWTDVVVRRAGSTSLTAPKANLRLDFPPGHPFVASFLDGPADELTLDGGHTNTDLIRENSSWDLMSGIGFPPIRSTHVRTMRSGTFQGLYLLREEQDGNWRARHNLDRGLLYKVEGTADTFGFSGEHEKKEGFDEPDTDMFTLRTCLDQTGAAFRTCALAQIDVPQLVNEIAATALIRNIDQREFNFLIYRDNTQNRLWRMIPDDLDRTWGIDGSGGQLGSPTVSSLKPYNRCIGADTTPANEMCRALMRWPEFEAMYNRRLRTLVDEVLNDPVWSTKIATLATLIGPDWDDDEAKWNRTSFTFPTIVNALDGWIDAYVAHQRGGGHDGKVPAAQSSAPVVTISEYRSDPGDGLGYVILTNPSTTESVDLSNWRFAGLAEIPSDSSCSLAPPLSCRPAINFSGPRTRPSAGCAATSTQHWLVRSHSCAATARRSRRQAKSSLRRLSSTSGTPCHRRRRCLAEISRSEPSSETAATGSSSPSSTRSSTCVDGGWCCPIPMERVRWSAMSWCLPTIRCWQSSRAARSSRSVNRSQMTWRSTRRPATGTSTCRRTTPTPGCISLPRANRTSLPIMKTGV